MCISCIVPTGPSVHDPQDQNSTVPCRISRTLSSWVFHPKNKDVLCRLNSTLSVSYPRCMECHIPHCSNPTVCLRLAPVLGMRPTCLSLFQKALCCQIFL